ncbi:uncharacterized protein EAF01_009284 [Botrytis porri]|uniref:uncharacterized protein n=1 Tax=Botrytis porri TaxID=87229 RepID=UPI0018FFE40C|nr:uncharacterized protein EAF01_009284 [Botrytis porri]KAF7896881.1 hypothetical protein EAF01_009284 [Botrytis porri]
MLYQIHISILLSLIASTSAYWIQFNDESRCASKETQRSWSGSTSRGFQARFSKIASSAFVMNTGTSDDNIVVAFILRKTVIPKVPLHESKMDVLELKTKILEPNISHSMLFEPLIRRGLRRFRRMSLGISMVE